MWTDFNKSFSFALWDELQKKSASRPQICFCTTSQNLNVQLYMFIILARMIVVTDDNFILKLYEIQLFQPINFLWCWCHLILTSAQHLQQRPLNTWHSTVQHQWHAQCKTGMCACWWQTFWMRCNTVINLHRCDQEHVSGYPTFWTE